MSQDVAKVSQTSEERARALVTFERRAVAAENDHERLSEMIARLETSLAAETKRAERAEDDGEDERRKEQWESADGERRRLRRRGGACEARGGETENERGGESDRERRKESKARCGDRGGGPPTKCTGS